MRRSSGAAPAGICSALDMTQRYEARGTTSARYASRAHTGKPTSLGTRGRRVYPTRSVSPTRAADPLSHSDVSVRRSRSDGCSGLFRRPWPRYSRRPTTAAAHARSRSAAPTPSLFKARTTPAPITIGARTQTQIATRLSIASPPLTKSRVLPRMRIAEARTARVRRRWANRSIGSLYSLPWASARRDHCRL
jgi:hypothetical protein